MLGSLFARPQAAMSSSVWGSWGDEGAGNTSSGERVTTDSAAQLLAVYGSASLITDQVSTTPVDVEGGARPAWIDEPSDGLDRVAWMSQIAWSILLEGNAYLDVLLSRRGEVISADVLDPTKCVPERVNGRKVVKVNGLERRSVVHVPGRMWPGSLKGMSPVEYARQSIGLGLAAQRFGADFFASDGNMPGVIEAPTPLQPETMENIAKQWRRKRRTGGKGLPGVLQNGAQWKPTGVTNEQAQFLATRKYTAAEIAGQMFLLDPSDLGIPVEGSNLTYGNLQQRDQRRTRIALLPLVRRIEPALSKLLVTGQYRFDLDSHLRGNTKESYETLTLGLAGGFLTQDEVRAILGRDPIDGDEARVWQEVGLPALVAGGIMTINEARAQLGLGPIAGGDVRIVPDQIPAAST